jgi:transposase
MNVYESIQELRTRGYSKRRAGKELTIDKRTVRKYWEMSEQGYARYLMESAARGKILDPYREYIVKLLEEHREINSAVIDANLRMEYDDFKPSSRSVRLYVANLRDELGIPKAAQIRQYCEVEEQKAGFQAQVDMGQKELKDPYGKTIRIYIFCMVMSCSRYKFCCFLDRPFKAEDFVKAHDLSFKFFGGRTEEIVYDQDRVMIVSENAGDLILTETFQSYSGYAGFKIRLCRGHDPESKGKIEAVVKYVKNNFLFGRTYYGLDALNSDGLKWLERIGNAKIHESTKMVPARVFLDEKDRLKLVPELSEPPQANIAAVRKTNVVHYKQNRYEVPKGSYRPGRQALVEADLNAGTLRISDTETGALLAEHNILFDTKGKKVSLPRNAERYRETKFEDLKRSILDALPGNPHIAGFLERIHTNYHRYTRDQYAIIAKAIKSYGKEEIAIALNYCVEHDLYSAPYFRESLIYFRGAQPPLRTANRAPLPEKYENVRVQERELSAYDVLLKGGATE